MSPRTRRSTALTTSAVDCAGAVPPARRAALRTARFERRTTPDIWIDTPNSGFRFGGSLCMRKQCACLRGGIGGGAVGRSGRGWTCGSVAGFCARFTPAVCSSVGAVCARCALAVCAFLSVLCVRLPCRDAGLVCAAMRFLSPRLPSVYACCLWFCRGGLRLVRGWTCGFVAGFCARFSPAVCSSVGAVCARCALAVCASLSALCVRLPCRDAELVCSAMRFCCRAWASVYARRCGSVGAVCLGSRLSFFLCQEKRDGLRYLAFLFRRSRSPFVRSRSVGAVICLWWFTSGLAVSLWRSRRVTGDAGL